MKNDEVIQKSKKLKEVYNSNLYELIKDYNITVNYCELKDCKGFSTICEDINLIIINQDLEEAEKDFILAHEIGHTLFHDNTLRTFTYTANLRNKAEFQANLFALIFLSRSTLKQLKNDNISKLCNKICNVYENLIDYCIIE